MAITDHHFEYKSLESLTILVIISEFGDRLILVIRMNRLILVPEVFIHHGLGDCVPGVAARESVHPDDEPGQLWGDRALPIRGALKQSLCLRVAQVFRKELTSMH